MKGHRIRVSELVMVTTSSGSDSAGSMDGADIVLEPASSLASKPPASASSSTLASPGSSFSAKLQLSRISSLGHSNGQLGASPGGGAASSSPSGDAGRVWKFRCESKSAVDAWVRAFSEHGCRASGR